MKFTGAAMLSLAALPASSGHGHTDPNTARMGVLVDLTELGAHEVAQVEQRQRALAAQRRRATLPYGHACV